MNSLQRQLQFGLALSMMLLMALLWWAGSLAVQELGEDLIGSRLEHDAEGLLAAMEFPDNGESGLQWKGRDPIFKRPFSGHYYVISFDSNRVYYSRSLWDHNLDVPLLKPGERIQWHADGPSNQQLLVSARHYRKQGQAFTLAVAEDLTPLKNQLAVFQWTFAAISVVALMILLFIQQRVIHRSFLRLETVCADIRNLERGEVGALSEDVPSEILPLVREFNRLLMLLGQRMERSRNALGNLAHALKGPLNLLVQYLDDKALEGMPELQSRARAQTERIGQLMERELKRARLAGGGTPGHRFNPKSDLPDLVKVLKQVHAGKRLDIQWEVAEEVQPFGDREDILELMGNLLDNACKWATARVRSRVRNGEAVLILVEDDGPGLSEQELERLVLRGVRLDEAVEGHGLGLSIAKDIVKLYGGEMDFERSPELGGLRLRIRLRPEGADTARADNE